MSTVTFGADRSFSTVYESLPAAMPADLRSATR